MRQIIKNVYKFDELSSEAQEKALENLLYINMECDWWKGIYDDAEDIGLKIKWFDIDRSEYDNEKDLYSQGRGVFHPSQHSERVCSRMFA